MRVIEGKIKAWLPSHGNPENLKHDNPSIAINELYFSIHNMKSSGWSEVGEATFSIEVVDDNELIKNKVESLKAELTKARAEAQVKENQLLDKINQLLAITCNTVEVEA